MNNPSVSLFIKSYRGDREWLRYCLAALRRFGTGWREIVLVLDEGDQPHFAGFDFGDAEVLFLPKLCPHEPYVDQQCRKVHADELCSGDFILFVDSDAVAAEPFHVADFFDLSAGGPDHVWLRPLQLIRRWEDAGDAKCWAPSTARALGFAPAFETMATLPLLYHRSTLAGLRTHLALRSGSDAAECFRQVPGRDISEFNLLGNYALRFQPHLYDWRLADPATDGYPRCFRQHWSWGGITPELRAQLGALLS